MCTLKKSANRRYLCESEVFGSRRLEEAEKWEKSRTVSDRVLPDTRAAQPDRASKNMRRNWAVKSILIKCSSNSLFFLFTRKVHVSSQKSELCSHLKTCFHTRRCQINLNLTLSKLTFDNKLIKKNKKIVINEIAKNFW